MSKSVVNQCGLELAIFLLDWNTVKLGYYVPSREMKKVRSKEKYVLSKTKKGQRCSIGDVRDRRREHNNRVYVLY